MNSPSDWRGEDTSVKVVMRSAAEVLEETRNRPRLSTGSVDLDELLDGIESGLFYLLYGQDRDTKDLILHRLLVNCGLPPGRGGLGGKAVYLNFCNYYEEKTMLNPSRLAGLAKASGIDPMSVLDNNYGVFAFNELEQPTAVEEVVNTVEEDEEVRLIVVHGLTRFAETSKKKDEALEVLRKTMVRLKRAASERPAALVASSDVASTRRGRIPPPEGGGFLRQQVDILTYLHSAQVGQHSVVEAVLMKHHHKETPQRRRLYVSTGGIDLMGRVTPSFRQIYQAQIEELRKHFQRTLLDPDHREAFDALLREAWQPEDHALGNAKIPYVLDVMNLMGNVHLKAEVARLRKELSELKRQLAESEEGQDEERT
jgi:hypothetical protein